MMSFIIAFGQAFERNKGEVRVSYKEAQVGK